MKGLSQWRSHGSRSTAGLVVPTVGKQGALIAGARHQVPWEWWRPHSGVTSKLNLSGNTSIDALKGVFPWWFWVKWSWQWRLPITVTKRLKYHVLCYPTRLVECPEGKTGIPTGSAARPGHPPCGSAHSALEGSESSYMSDLVPL